MHHSCIYHCFSGCICVFIVVYHDLFMRTRLFIHVLGVVGEDEERDTIPFLRRPCFDCWCIYQVFIFMYLGVSIYVHLFMYLSLFIMIDL